MSEEPIIGATYYRTYIYRDKDFVLRTVVDEVECVMASKVHVSWKMRAQKAPAFENMMWDTFTQKPYEYWTNLDKFPMDTTDEDSWVEFVMYKLKELP